MQSMQIQRSGYRSSSSLSPTSLAGVIVVHAALGAAIVSMTAIKIFHDQPPVLDTYNVRYAPPPTKVDPVPPLEAQKTAVTTPKPILDVTEAADPSDFVKPDSRPILGDAGGIGPIIDPVQPPITPDPVFFDAKPDPRFISNFQPAYPAGMLRLQMEGKVTVRVSIDAEGRVRDVTLISAPDPAFFEATKKQALSRWRFTPATRDGVAVPSERVMTVTFRITD